MFNTTIKTWARKLMWGSFVIAAAGGIVIALVTIDDPEFPQRRAVCDRVVETALTTTDLVEFERSTFIAGKLSCSFRRRILAHSTLASAAPPPPSH